MYTRFNLCAGKHVYAEVNLCRQIVKKETFISQFCTLCVIYYDDSRFLLPYAQEDAPQAIYSQETLLQSIYTLRQTVW